MTHSRPHHGTMVHIHQAGVRVKRHLFVFVLRHARGARVCEVGPITIKGGVGWGQGVGVIEGVRVLGKGKGFATSSAAVFEELTAC